MIVVVMLPHDSPIWWLILAAGAVMTLALLRGLAHCSIAQAQVLIDQRRQEEIRQREARAEAEAAGRAAALEPLALRADGTIEEPILALAENR